MGMLGAWGVWGVEGSSGGEVSGHYLKGRADLFPNVSSKQSAFPRNCIMYTY